jgi:hypothetical protein
LFARVHSYAARTSRANLHFAPTSASWLNLVERWFAELTFRKLRRSAHHSMVELERGIRGWIRINDSRPTGVV